jgi:murein DD-endopeptidase MepM/ murein hydrolase activator NlpD
MPRPLTFCWYAAVLGLAMSSPAVSAHEPSGGATYKARPSVTKFECANGDTGRCPRGELLRVRGEGLQQADSVLFLGRDGHEDDKVARTNKRSPHRVVVRVPPDAKTGPVRIKSRYTGLSRPSRPLRVLAAVAPGGQPLPVVPVGEGVFPVRDKYDFGTEINGFGGGRGHRGQDIFATCGTPLVSARSGIVTVATSEARAGNYAVITADDGTSQAYMHMLAPATVMRDQRVIAGQPIGQVGQSGRASGCHLHFELWTAPGWYQGGTAVDPLPELQQYATRG